MSQEKHDHPSAGVTGDGTSALPTDFLGEFDDAGTASDEAGVLEVGGLPYESPVLVVTRGINTGAQFVLGQPVTSAGRLPVSDIVLDDITVSRRHAEFRCKNAGFLIVDVGSLNGTYVNRQRVDSAELTDGDQIQIGRFRLVFLSGRTMDG
jgi:pSer/pThr/pTyr-binding forkhead associated (FHA) protein